MRKTKIICTIGPASESESVLTQMCKAGMNVARLNFSHGSHEEHQKKIDMIKKVRKALGLPIGIMLDTKGPEYRIKTFENGKITLKDGDTFTLTTDDIVGNQERVSVTYKNLINNLKVGDHVLINNGLIILEVEKLKAPDAICKVLVGGEVSDKKSMNFPNKVMDHAFLSEQDKKTCHNRDRDARVHDSQSASDTCRAFRCGKCGIRWIIRDHAVRGISCR